MIIMIIILTNIIIIVLISIIIIIIMIVVVNGGGRFWVSPTRPRRGQVSFDRWQSTCFGEVYLFDINCTPVYLFDII